jgi:hypothetical protein
MVSVLLLPAPWGAGPCLKRRAPALGIQLSATTDSNGSLSSWDSRAYAQIKSGLPVGYHLTDVVE